MADLYRVLGVGPDASRTEIARAYRREARAAHPDSKPGDPEALARFRAVAEAYAILSDPARRSEYDHQRRPAPGSHPAPGSPPADPPISAFPRSWGTGLGTGWAPGWGTGWAPGRVTSWEPAEDGPPLWAGPVWVEPLDPDERS